MMGEFAISVLLALSTWLGVEQTPSNDGYWNVLTSWQSEKDYFKFVAESKSIANTCDSHKDYQIVFPRIIHGVHRIFINGQLILETGDSTFKRASSFYEAPNLECKQLKAGDTLNWEVISYTKYFARFKEFPRVQSNTHFAFLRSTTIYLLFSGFILALSLISMLIYSDKKLVPAIKPFFWGSFLLVAHMAGCVNTMIGFNLSMLAMHKIADLSLWSSIVLTFYFFYRNQLLSELLFKIHVLFSIIASIILFLGVTGDEVQFGTSVPFLTTLISFIVIAVNAVKIYLREGRLSRTFPIFIGTISVILLGVNDMFIIFGLTDSYLLFPVGVSVLVFATALSINVEIKDTYKQRDELLQSLEDKVNEKTRHLTEALSTIQRSQAELIESSRLASLGTLSAGIAHEINNSINFIHGAIVPLEKKVLKLVNEEEADSLKKLFNVIKDGTKLTIEIVQSLRTFTGLNQSDLREMNVKEVVDSILTILKGKLRDYVVTVNIDPNLRFWGHQVGINQIVMNLVTNAIDACESGKTEIIIVAEKKDGELVIIVEDKGIGIPEEIRSRIFDPFYTTKSIGKGTGLGLHIIKKEVDRYKGKIELSSEVNKGTRFVLHLPELPNEEAA